MSQKRKGKSLLEKVAKFAKASQESEKFDEEKSQYFKQMESAFERQNETESKDAFFSRVYNDSSPLDHVLEFLIFKREAEKLLPELRDELVKIVRHHLRVDEAIADLKLEKRLENEETPLLDALGAKLGTSFAYILAPPVHQCLLCSKPLKKQHKVFVQIEEQEVELLFRSKNIYDFLQTYK